MSQANSFEWQMLDLINQERTSRGLDPLQLDLRLNDSSEDHSADMLAQDYFSHTGLDGSSAGGRMQEAGFVFSGSWTWGENIAWQSERGAPGIADDVINLHNALMNSPGHRANILNPNFEVIGIGIEQGNYNGWDAVMVTQNFAKTSAPLEIDTGGGSGGGGGGGGGTTPPDDPVLIGNSGNNTLIGGSSGEEIRAKGGNDMVQGNGGGDAIWGGKGTDNVDGGSGSDELRGGGGKDTVDGGSGNDTLFGGGGRDTIDGGSGNDTLTGGGGGDVFVFSGGNDVVTDFNLASGSEVVDLSGVGSITSFADLQANHLFISNGDAVIADGFGNSITLDGIDPYALTASEFIF